MASNAGWTRQQTGQAWATANLAASPRAATSEWVTITVSGQQLKAWVDYPLGTEKASAVIVGHEVFGLTDSTRNTADQIAAMGYIAITPDFTSGLGPDGTGDVQTLVASDGQTSTLLTSLSDDQINERFDAWVDYAKGLSRSNGLVDIVGLSWSGGAAFRYAQSGTTDVNAIAVFYDVGAPTVTQGCHRNDGLTDYPVDDIRVPIYGFYGETDTRATGSVPLTTTTMAAYGKFFDPVVYAGADHAFMRVGSTPTANAANKAAAQAATTRLQGILAASFAGSGDTGIDVDATVPAAAPGSLALTVAGDHVTLSQAANAGDHLRFMGQLPAVTVTDSRSAQQAGAGGWSVAGQASALTGPMGTVDADNLGWVPYLLTTRPGLAAGTSAVSALSGGAGLSTPATLASASSAGRYGSAQIGAGLSLDVPVDTTPGTYGGTLTVSLFPVD
ncbi:dienelactone hydrolase family protein [Microbacterium sp. PRC9]|uniref:dienelactone hydrolase family protein n=1 Tax=Microbacterium sp. PRC9 TaxID=2962591 RepID=UPI002882696B|nr:dienelactone hydrolase family protein [Microbacterium sp. PRC9]MDT0144516.1 dienelactone hydrolase family protein [Microbacterium sp. PRC9]